MFETFYGSVFFMALAAIWLFQTCAKKHPEVTDAAKKAATAKAISLIGKWLR